MQLDPSTFRISWRPDGGRRWDVKDGEQHGQVLALSSGEFRNDFLSLQLRGGLADFDSLANNDRQIWRLDRDTSLDSNGTAKWMASVPGDTKLSDLNIVGTHQSLALHAKGLEGNVGDQPTFPPILDNPRCQNRSPLEQMVAGVRSFDCRFDVWTSNKWPNGTSLYAWHGANNPIIGAAEGYSFTAVLQSAKLFLEQSPSETLWISVRNETGTDGFEQAFLHDFEGFASICYPKDIAGKQSIRTINLDDVRGKAVVLVDHGSNAWAQAVNRVLDPAVFFPDAASTKSAGKYDTPKSQWQKNVDDIVANIEDAKKQTDGKFWYTTSWNASVAVDLDFLNGNTGYNPIDFFNFARDAMVQVFRQDNIGVDGQNKLGLINFDFYEKIPDQTLQIIRSNRGCANVQQHN